MLLTFKNVKAANIDFWEAVLESKESSYEYFDVDTAYRVPCQDKLKK